MNDLGRLTPAALLAFGLGLAPRPARADSCTGSAQGGSNGTQVCLVAPLQAVRHWTARVARAAPRREPVGPQKTEADGTHVHTGLSMSERAGPLSGEIRSVREIVESDLEMRDCHGSLCGPQSLTLRVGSLDQGRQATFPPIIGGLGAVVGAFALAIKPGPRREPAPGPSLDGWAQGPKGLKPAGPPFMLQPLISVTNGVGGLRALVSW